MGYNTGIILLPLGLLYFTSGAAGSDMPGLPGVSEVQVDNLKYFLSWQGLVSPLQGG